MERRALDLGGVGVVIFPASPDAGTFRVNWMIDNNDGTFSGNLQWSHIVTTAEDLGAGCGPGGCGSDGQIQNWLVEGIFDTYPIPLPAAAYLFGSGLVGLAGVARRRRKKGDK